MEGEQARDFGVRAAGDDVVDGAELLEGEGFGVVRDELLRVEVGVGAGGFVGLGRFGAGDGEDCVQCLFFARNVVAICSGL